MDPMVYRIIIYVGTCIAVSFATFWNCRIRGVPMDWTLPWNWWAAMAIGAFLMPALAG